MPTFITPNFQKTSEEAIRTPKPVRRQEIKADIEAFNATGGAIRPLEVQPPVYRRVAGTLVGVVRPRGHDYIVVEEDNTGTLFTARVSQDQKYFMNKARPGQRYSFNFIEVPVAAFGTDNQFRFRGRDYTADFRLQEYPRRLSEPTQKRDFSAEPALNPL